MPVWGETNTNACDLYMYIYRGGSLGGTSTITPQLNSMRLATRKSL